MAVTSGPERIREQNKRAVLAGIVQGPLSRAELSEHTGLTRPTISTLVSELLSEGWIVESGPGESSGGRRPVLLQLDPTSRRFLGAEVGAGHIRAVVVDLSGKVLHRQRERVQSETLGGNIQRLTEVLATLIERAGPTPPILGIGLGLVGMVDPAAGTWRYSPHFGGQDYPVVQVLRERFGLPVRAENDARAMTLGEWCFGAGRGARDLVGVRVGMGVGSGILLEGNLYAGAQAGAGEVGHTTVDPEGPRCRCGSYGCLEAVAGAPALAGKAVKAVRQGQPSLVSHLVGGDLIQVHAAVVIDAALQGDALAQAIIAEQGHYLGVAVGNLINLLNPTCIVVGGSGVRAGSLLLDPLRRTASARALEPLREHLRIVAGSLGEEAVAIGAAGLLIRETLPELFFQRPE